MKIYFALSTDIEANPSLFDLGVEYLLYSYHYYKTESRTRRLKKMGLFDTKAPFLDSGAFSAYTLGKKININEYIKYIKQTGIKLYSNLDCIGNPDKTIENEQYMITQGLNPIPVFHTKENLKYLDRILNCANYIALGGMVMTSNLDYWLKNAWSYILRERPGIKVHGFGLMDPNLILKYPWYSVDSSSWAGCVRFARFSYWNPEAAIFTSKSIEKVFRELGIVHIKGDPIIGEPRKRIINYQIKHFLMMIDYIKNKKRNIDYSYLTAQESLF